MTYEPVVITQVDSYSVYISAQQGSTEPATIVIKCANARFCLNFRYSITATQVVETPDYVLTVYYPVSMFGPIQDVLRNEKPLHVHFNSHVFQMGTDTEIARAGENPMEGRGM